MKVERMNKIAAEAKRPLPVQRDKGIDIGELPIDRARKLDQLGGGRAVFQMAERAIVPRTIQQIIEGNRPNQSTTSKRLKLQANRPDNEVYWIEPLKDGLNSGFLGMPEVCNTNHIQLEMDLKEINRHLDREYEIAGVSGSKKRSWLTH